jgi:hypothetical protein
MRTVFITLALFAFLSVPSSSIALIINVPGDEPSIQDGINAAADGDTVLVHPGTYTENISFDGKDITVSSLFLTTGDPAYIDQTVIDGDSVTTVVTFDGGEGPDAVLSGMTITNGGGEHRRLLGKRPLLLQLTSELGEHYLLERSP